MVRVLARSTQLLIDLLVLSMAFWLAFLIRFDWSVPPFFLNVAVFLWPYVVGFQFLLLMLFGVHRFAWRYVGLRETIRILGATGTALSLLLVVRMVSGHLLERVDSARYTVIPTGVILIDFGMAFLAIAGVRITRRLLAEHTENVSRRHLAKQAVPTLLIGAGQAGLMVAKEISNRPDLGIQPVGFLDDDPVKIGTVVHGIPVLAATSELKHVAHRLKAQQVLITIVDAGGAVIRRVKGLADEAGIPAKIVPGIYEIVGGQVNLSRIRSVTIEDLLGREAVQLETEAISRDLNGRVVLVTGAGGSIGSELCRQVCQFEPRRLLLVERAENNLFQIHRELVTKFPLLAERIVPCIADVGDESRMTWLFEQYQPNVVFHAAAHKHVPMMEANPGEAIKNNVLGTKLVADLAHRFQTGQFVLISTDKAVNPTSVMGATKRVAEIYLQALSQRSQTRFVAVRFGNVLGSAGSVIPIFQEQIARGGPVTVTHPEMKRYFMTIPEACQLVLQAGTMGQGGEIFVLDMGEPVKIVDLARDLITLSGLVPGEDVEIEFTGMRPGEKLFEELLVEDEFADRTRHPKIFVSRIRAHPWSEIEGQLTGLRSVVGESDAQRIRASLRAIVPEFGAEAVTGITAASKPQSDQEETAAPSLRPLAAAR